MDVFLIITRSYSVLALEEGVEQQDGPNWQKMMDHIHENLFDYLANPVHSCSTPSKELLGCSIQNCRLQPKVRVI